MDYALVTAIFALIMLAGYTGIQGAAGSNITGTQTGLSAEAKNP